MTVAQLGSVECIACGGSGASSRGGVCKPCKGTGSLSDDVVPPQVPQHSSESESVAPQVPQHSSESVEHFTPAGFVEPSRQMLGEIDLDPASCAQAQEIVGATMWYGPGSPHGEDGLVEPWGGRVFLNPPGGLVAEEHLGMGTRSNAALWWGMLASAWESGDVEAAIFVGFTLEILRSAQALDVPQPLDFPFCVPSSRISFDTPNRMIEKGKHKGELIDPEQPEGARVTQSSPGHANVIVYLPPLGADFRGAPIMTQVERERFIKFFGGIGRIKS